MAGPAAHVAAISINRTNAPLACAAGASLASPNLTTATLENEPSGRTLAILPGLPTSPESAASACGNSSAVKPDKDSKVRAPPSPQCYSLKVCFATERTHCSTALQVLTMGKFMCHVPGIRWCRNLGTAPASCPSCMLFYIFNTLELSGPLLGKKETTVNRMQSTSACSFPNLKEEFRLFQVTYSFTILLSSNFHVRCSCYLTTPLLNFFFFFDK